MQVAMHRFLCCLVVLALTGCGAVASIQRLPIPERTAPIPAEATRVVVLRKAQAIGSGRSVLVFSGQREVGRLAAGSHLMWDNPTGRRLLRVVFDRPKLDGGPLETYVDHKVPAGQIVYYEVAVQGPSGSTPGTPVVTRIEEAEGLRRMERSDPARFEREQ